MIVSLLLMVVFLSQVEASRRVFYNSPAAAEFIIKKGSSHYIANVQLVVTSARINKVTFDLVDRNSNGFGYLGRGRVPFNYSGIKSVTFYAGGSVLQEAYSLLAQAASNHGTLVYLKVRSIGAHTYYVLELGGGAVINGAAPPKK